MSNELNDDVATPGAPVGETTWDDDSIRTSDLTFFKGEKNGKKRVYVMSERPKFARVHYQGGYFVCKSVYENKDGVQQCVKTAKCCELVGEAPKMRFSAVVLVYDTKKDGTVKTKDPQELDFGFQIWVFGEDKFVSLRTKHQEWDLTQHDLLIACTDEQFQKIEIDVMKNALWQSNATLKARVQAAWAAFGNKDTQKFLGKVLSDAEIAAKVGVATDDDDSSETTTSNMQVGGKNLDDVLAELHSDAEAPTEAAPAAKETTKKGSAAKSQALED